MLDEYEVPAPQKLFIPLLAPIYRALAPLSYAGMRIFFGLLLLPIGFDKVFMGGAARIAAGNIVKAGFYPPLVWAWIVSGLEFFGALLLIAGLWTRPIAFMAAIEMAVITFRIRLGDGYFITPTGRGMEVSVLLLGLCIALMLGGSGRYSADRWIGREF